MQAGEADQSRIRGFFSYIRESHEENQREQLEKFERGEPDFLYELRGVGYEEGKFDCPG